MKHYSQSPTASIRMHDSKLLRVTLRSLIEKIPVTHVLESGTFRGLGSTTFIAESFPTGTQPEQFITLEANWNNWRHAKRNLKRFSFVNAVWGHSIAQKEALEFIAADPILDDHGKHPDVFIDHLENPREKYASEIRGQLGHASRSPKKLAQMILGSLAKPFQFSGENLLSAYLESFADKKPLVVLDSSGGMGYLEFQTVDRKMRDKPFVLLLDDIHHLKHFRSYADVKTDPKYTIAAVDEREGWMLAVHLDTRIR